MSRDNREASGLKPGAVIVDRVWKRFRPDRGRALLRDKLSGLRRPTSRSASRFTWALRDVSLRMEPGDSVALLGSNGSGKSTLLKVLTRVMYPYAGRIEVAGRVGALIEVTSGIHPDLSGRENCYLYGSLLGLSRADVGRRFDEIVDFAELEQAIDRQVKFYSSGMKMRLGFAIAAYLEPDVLLVDEVLSVGDARFQQRCLGRMSEVLHLGTTLVYVSHDLATVESMCQESIWLNKGVIEARGTTEEVLGRYRAWVEQLSEDDQPNGPIKVRSAVCVNPSGGGPRTSEPLDIEITVESEVTSPATVNLGISLGPGWPLLFWNEPFPVAAGEANPMRLSIGSLPLPRGRYYVWCAIDGRNEVVLMSWRPVATIDVYGPDLDPIPAGIVRPAPIYCGATWEIRR